TRRPIVPSPIDPAELERLLRLAKPVPGTHPPVYMFEGGLIGFDKLEQMKIIARSPQVPAQKGWLRRVLKILSGTTGGINH
ncbi:MAG: hypothetical protein AB1801_27755, partial [Chloroflexota bacterium]